MNNINLKGYVSNIQRYSVNDGGGVRTTIFLSGCPLRCRWCSNPETWTIKPKILFLKNKCTGCGICYGVCPVNALNEKSYVKDHELCTSCERCVKSCLNGARVVSGKYISVEEVLEEVKKDIIFFRESGGGVTFSGGEPICQSVFLKEIVEGFYKLGLHMAIETCGYFHWEDAADILSKMDLIFIDLKHMDSDEHEKLTGVRNNLILENLEKIGRLKKDTVIRVPVIKGVNDSDNNIRKTAEFVRDYIPNGKIELLPYHRYGIDKYKALGLPFPNKEYERPREEKIKQLKMLIEESGVGIVEYK